jgi:acetyl-CoA C-acetyltransferase
MGMMAQRYMHETGVTPEEMASVVVSLRKWAALDPNSMFYKKEVPSVEKVLSSPMISTPLHKRECNILADGGAALVVMSSEEAKKMNKPVAHKLGEGAVYFSACPVLRDHEAVAEGWRDSAHEALDEAGIAKEDIDIWNIYVAYPFAQPIMLEAIGICE